MLFVEQARRARISPHGYSSAASDVYERRVRLSADDGGEGRERWRIHAPNPDYRGPYLAVIHI